MGIESEDFKMETVRIDPKPRKTSEWKEMPLCMCSLIEWIR
jgi:hypothetical protein